MTFRQNQLIAMATSLDKSENEVLSYGEKIVNIGAVHPEIFD